MNCFMLALFGLKIPGRVSITRSLQEFHWKYDNSSTGEPQLIGWGRNLMLMVKSIDMSKVCEEWRNVR